VPKAKIELQLDSPIGYIEVIDGPAFKGRTIEFKESKGKLEIIISAETTKDLLAAIDGVTKKLMIVGSTEDIVKNSRKSKKQL
jgi:hypothetical protein